MPVRVPAETTAYSVVVPSIGRPSLRRLIEALGRASGPSPDLVIVVDDRVWAGEVNDADRGARGPAIESELDLPPSPFPVKVLAGRGRGPAAARNVGWRAAATEWVVFLDDDVVPTPSWRKDLAADLDAASALGDEVAGSQGRIVVPRPAGRRPTDWERNVAGLEHACWATADLAYRRTVLEEVGGFDERFPRAFREDADLGLRVRASGYLIVRGERRVEHPVRAAGPLVSVRLQAGNADDVLMRALHGPGWRHRAGAEAGRTGRHLLTTAGGMAGLAGVGFWAWRRARRAAGLPWPVPAGAALWAVGTVELSWARIKPGPRAPGEITRMLGTSLLLPPVATYHLVRGWLRLPALFRDRTRAPLGRPRSPLALVPPAVWVRPSRRPRSPLADPSWRPAALLFDRDGTLVADVPYNADPDRVALMPGARLAVARARRAGCKVGIVTNQSGVARGHISGAQLQAVHRRLEELIGPIDVWAVCPHAPSDGCDCRKPPPGLITAAAAQLGVAASACAVIGDIGSDMEAARAAGGRGVLVPTAATRGKEVAAANVVAPDLLTAVDLVLAGRC